MAIKNQKIVADFETTTTPDDVRVWAVCAVDIDSLETVYIGNNLDDFMEWLSKRNTVCYYHNAKFDLEFVWPWLFKNGFKYSQKHLAKTFDTLISDDGVVYSARITFEKLNKKYKAVTFYDSLKKLPFKVSTISKAFELEDEKLVIDYDAHRPVDHELTEEEKAYIVNDCRIVAAALKIQFSKGLKKMTNASDAMNGYKEIISKDLFSKWFPVLPVEMDLDIRQAYKGGFVYLNPKYAGMTIEKARSEDVNSLYPSVMYDRMLPYGYPMYFEGKPKDDPVYNLFIVHMKCTFELKPGHLPTLQLKGSRRFVETEYLTTSRDDDGGNEPVELYLTNVDYQLMLDHYDIEDETYINGYRFKGATGMFTRYIDFWMHIKETTTGAERALAKLMLNSLYGRYALNPKAYQKIPYMDDDGVVRYATPVLKGYWIDKKGNRHDTPPDNETVYVGTGKREIYRTEKVQLREPVYTAMACFITAYAREKTIRSAQTVYDRFIYADTDSLHLEGWETPEGLEIHPTKLGAWKNEGLYCKAVYLRAKTYIESKEETKPDTLRNYARFLCNPFTDWVNREPEGIRASVRKVTCAGMPDNVKEHVTYDNFKPGATFHGKLLPRRYPGGIVLTETDFTIK